MAEQRRWVWETGTQRYRDLATGRFLSNTDVIGIVNDIVDKTTDNPVTTINTMLADGRLNVANWKTGFARQIKNAYIQQAELAAGGRAGMTPQMWGSVGGSVREQYRYLDKFAKQIEGKQLSPVQIEARTKMYINSSRESYWRIKDMKAQGAGMTEERWIDEGDSDVCGPCSDAGAMGWQPIGTFAQPGSGRVMNRPRTNCQGLTNCRCRKEYRKGAEQEEPGTETEPVPEGGTPPPEDRTPSDQERTLVSEIEETRPVVQEMIDAGDPTGGGMLGYLQDLEKGLQEERSINEALWNEYQLLPEQATDNDWENLADSLQQEGYDLYKKYTKEGIAIDVAEQRGAQESGYMIVGKEQVIVRQGAFSAREAQRIQGEVWAQAKSDVGAAIGDYLQDLGYSQDDISNADYFQRIKLLEELGNQDLSRTRAGRVSKIDDVPTDARSRVMSIVDLDTAATAADVAIDPLHVPTLDAYGKMELSDLIRSTKIAGIAEPTWAEPAELNF